MRLRSKLGTLGMLLGSLVLLAAASLSPAQAQTVDEIISRGKLIVAIDTTTPPYGLVDADLKPTGFDIDVANTMGEALGVPVEFVTVTSPGRIPSLLTKQVDCVISIFSITAAARDPDRLFHPLCRPVVGGASRPRARRSRDRRISSARRSASPAAPARTAC